MLFAHNNHLSNTYIRKVTFFLFTIFISLIITSYPPTILATNNFNITASNTYQKSNPNNIIDNNIHTTWNSGKSAPQWIQLDLKSPRTINQINLLPSQSPAGRTIHVISAGPTPTTLKHVITIDQITKDNQWINIPLLKPIPNVRYVKISTTTSPSWISWREIQVKSGNTPAKSHLKYFGYMSSNGLGINISSDYYTELENLNNTNIAWATIANLDEFKKLNIQALLTEPRWIFFQNGELKPNWQTLWNNYKTKLSSYNNTIYGFYFDEPVWKGYSKTAFLTATKAIHDTFPNKAILIIEAEPPLTQNTIPQDYYQYVTDIGLDYYFTLHSDDNNIGWNQFLNLFEKLKPYINNKKIWFVPDGYGYDIQNINTKWPDAFEKYLSLALTTDNCLGIMPFIYDFHNAKTSTYTLKDILDKTSKFYIPSFRSRQIEVGQAIIANSQIAPPANPSDLNNDGKVDIFDYNILIAGFGTKYDIFDYNTLVSNYGK